MTALSGPILFNNSTGSDSAASGCGPATAISVMMQFSSGTNTATASWSGTISVGDLIYVPANTGRKFNVIASVGSGSLTFDDNWDDTQSTTAGYVGGKRATLENSREIFPDVAQYLKGVIRLETDQTINSRIGPNGLAGVIESADDTIKTITQTANAAHFYGGYGSLFSGLIFKKIKFANSFGSSLNQPIFLWDNGSGYQSVYAEQCVFGDPTNQCYTLQSGGGSYHYYTFVIAHGCVIQNMLDAYAVSMTVDQKRPSFKGCLFRNNNRAIGVSGSGAGFSGTVMDCIFDSNAYGIQQHRSQNMNIQGNIFYNHSVAAISIGLQHPFNCNNNLFVNNAVCFNSGKPFYYKNYFYNNTVKFSASNNESLLGDVDLTADPFVDPTASPPDFNISDSAGGATLRSTNYTLGG